MVLRRKPQIGQQRENEIVRLFEALRVEENFDVLDLVRVWM
jgi:hypothetical protein